MAKTALIADIGGTNARFGVVDAAGVHDLVYLPCRDYIGPSEAAEVYLKQIGGLRPALGVFAIAGPADDDLVSFTNIPWPFRKSKLQQQLGLEKLEVINDFHAVALAIPDIAPELLHHIGGNELRAERAKGVIGPGTGLGVASLAWTEHGYVVQPGEGGHVTMPATTDREFELFRQLRVKYHHISAERVCSGKGLENIYNGLRALDRQYDLPDLTAPEISEKAIAGTCATCRESLDLMLGFLGRVTGNLALTVNATGGIYIAGGIPTKLGNYFFNSRFHEEFMAKGRFKDYMAKIPVYMIKHDAIGLLGLESRARDLLKTV
jgi:glucokinase